MKTIHIMYFFLATAHLTVASERKQSTQPTNSIIRTTGKDDKDSWETYAREGIIALRITPHNNRTNYRYLVCIRDQETGKISKNSDSSFWHSLCQKWLEKQSNVKIRSYEAIKINRKK